MLKTTFENKEEAFDTLADCAGLAGLIRCSMDDSRLRDEVCCGMNLLQDTLNAVADYLSSNNK